MNIDFNGDMILVSEGTLNTEVLITAVMDTLEDITGEDFTVPRRNLSHLDNDDQHMLLDELSERLDATANRYGYTFGTVEGDGACFVLAPLSREF